jgi:predicted esterase
MNNGEKLNNRPILILHGIKDSSVSIENQRVFFNKMLPLYSDNLEEFQFQELSGVDHMITVGMMQETVTWFKKYL